MGGEGMGWREKQGKGEKKVIPCIGAAGGIAQMMLRWEGHVWRKKASGLMFLYLQPDRQAGLKEGYLRQRHLRNKLEGPHGSVVHDHCLKPGCGTLDLTVSIQQQQPPLSPLGRGSSQLPLHMQRILAVQEPGEGLWTFHVQSSLKPASEKVGTRVCV